MLNILSGVRRGLNGKSIAGELEVSKQKVSWWLRKFVKWGWIIPTVPETNRAPGGKYYKLSETCKRFLSTTEDQIQQRVLEVLPRLEHVDFDSVILEADGAGLERLRCLLRKVDGIRNWVKHTGAPEGVSFELHETPKQRKLVFHAPTVWGGSTHGEMVSRAQSFLEGYARRLERTFGLELAPLQLSWVASGKKPRWEGAVNGGPLLQLMMARNGKLRNGSAQGDGSWPHNLGDLDWTDLDKFDKFVHFLENLDVFGEQQREMLNRMVRVEGKQGAVDSALIEFANQIRVHDAVMRGIDANVKAQTEATREFTEAIEKFLTAKKKE
jgi:hypothetical protein